MAIVELPVGLGLWLVESGVGDWRTEVQSTEVLRTEVLVVVMESESEERSSKSSSTGVRSSVMVASGPFKVNLFKIDRQLQYDKFKIIQTLSTLSAFDTPTVSEWLINLRALIDHNLVLLLSNPVPTFLAYSEAHGVAISDIRHDDVAMATMTERFTMHTLAYDDVMAIVASIIIARVRWQYEPTLRTLVHGDPMAEDSTSRDGHGLYYALIRLADSSRAVVQD